MSHTKKKVLLLQYKLHLSCTWGNCLFCHAQESSKEIFKSPHTGHVLQCISHIANAGPQECDQFFIVELKCNLMGGLTGIAFIWHFSKWWVKSTLSVQLPTFIHFFTPLKHQTHGFGSVPSSQTCHIWFNIAHNCWSVLQDCSQTNKKQKMAKLEEPKLAPWHQRFPVQTWLTQAWMQKLVQKDSNLWKANFLTETKSILANTTQFAILSSTYALFSLTQHWMTMASTSAAWLFTLAEPFPIALALPRSFPSWLPPSSCLSIGHNWCSCSLDHQMGCWTWNSMKQYAMKLLKMQVQEITSQKQEMLCATKIQLLTKSCIVTMNPTCDFMKHSVITNDQKWTVPIMFWKWKCTQHWLWHAMDLWATHCTCQWFAKLPSSVMHQTATRFALLRSGKTMC